MMILRAVMSLALLIAAGLASPSGAADLEFPIGSPIGMVHLPASSLASVCRVLRMPIVNR